MTTRRVSLTSVISLLSVRRQLQRLVSRPHLAVQAREAGRRRPPDMMPTVCRQEALTATKAPWVAPVTSMCTTLRYC
jgi:hypothetical protein